MTIHQYIKDLLLFNEKVILPGLGAIESERVPSSIESGKMIPPSSRIRFNSGESMDDRMLQNSIARGEEIEEEEASQRIQEFIDEIRFSLNKSETYEIEGVGTLSMEDDNTIRITRSPDFEEELDSFGLDSFELEEAGDEGMSLEDVGVEPEGGEKKEVEEEGLGEEVEEGIGEAGSEEQDAEQGTDPEGKDPEAGIEGENREEEAEVPAEEESREEDVQVEEREAGPEDEYLVSPVKQEEDELPRDKEVEPVHAPVSEGPESLDGDASGREIRRSNRNTLWIIGGGIFVILAGFVLLSLFTDIFDDRIDLNSMFRGSDGTLEINDDFSGEDSEFDRMVKEMEDEIDSATRMENALDPSPEEESVPVVVPATEAAPDYYHIIAGSFRSEVNAQELQQQLTLKGYTPLVMELENGIYRVSALSFSDKATALKELVNFRENTGISGAWLMNLD